MSTTLSVGTCLASVGWDINQPGTIGSTQDQNGTVTLSQSFTQGTGAGKAQRILVANPSIAASGSQSYTLDNFTDPLNNASVAMTAVHGIFVNYLTTNSPTAALDISGTFTTAGGAPFLLTGTTPKLQMLPGNVLMITNNTAAGYPVTASTGNTITFHNQDGTKAAVLQIVIWGE